MNYRRRTKILLSNNVYLEIAWHHTKYILHAKITSPTGEHRSFYNKSRKSLFSEIRLALSRGTDNIYWDIPVMNRIKGK